MTQKSNKKQADRDIARAEMLSDLATKRRAYAERWEKSSSKFDADGHYEWMAGFARGFDRVLEIGTGTGRGTLALLRDGHVVVSVDENPECLQLARAAIEAAGFPVSVIQRGTVTGQADHYQVGYPKITAVLPAAGAVLVQGDIFDEPPGSGRHTGVDNNLETWLTAVGPFDAVACWLLGTHSARTYNISIMRRAVKSQQDYRLRVQNYTYELANRLLRSGGVLHIIDRGQAFVSDTEKLDVINSHRDQASTTSLAVETDVQQRPYEDDPEGIGMVISPPLSGRTTGSPLNFLTSVRAFKP